MSGGVWGGKRVSIGFKAGEGVVGIEGLRERAKVEIGDLKDSL